MSFKFETTTFSSLEILFVAEQVSRLESWRAGKNLPGIWIIYIHPKPVLLEVARLYNARQMSFYTGYPAKRFEGRGGGLYKRGLLRGNSFHIVSPRSSAFLFSEHTRFARKLSK